MSRDSDRLCFRSRDPEHTRTLAAQLAGAIRDDASDHNPRRAIVLVLSGDLGAGKTVFVKGLAQGLEHDSELVSSPTYVTVNQYATGSGPPLAHVDFYRLQSSAELEGIGFYDLLLPGAVVAVEWGERFAKALPRDRLEVTLADASSEPSDAVGATVERADVGEANSRTLEASATGPRSQRILARWRSALDDSGDSSADSRPLAGDAH